MTTRQDLRFTADHYRALPETGPQYQLVEGELICMTPAPIRRHQRVVTRFTRVLDAHVEAKDLGEVYVAPFDVYLSKHNVFQPDVVFVSKARALQLVERGMNGGPDLVVEVLSESTRALDLGPKKLRYAQHGVIEYWVADLETDTVSVYLLQENAETPARVLGKLDKLTSSLLPALEIDLAWLFS